MVAPEFFSDWHPALAQPEQDDGAPRSQASSRSDKVTAHAATIETAISHCQSIILSLRVKGFWDRLLKHTTDLVGGQRSQVGQ